MDPSETTCFGCICFWVRSLRFADGLEERVLRHLIDWLKDNWPLQHALPTTRTSTACQVSLFEKVGLCEAFRPPHPIEGLGAVLPVTRGRVAGTAASDRD